MGLVRLHFFFRCGTKKKNKKSVSGEKTVSIVEGTVNARVKKKSGIILSARSIILLILFFTNTCGMLLWIAFVLSVATGCEIEHGEIVCQNGECAVTCDSGYMEFPFGGAVDPCDALCLAPSEVSCQLSPIHKVETCEECEMKHACGWCESRGLCVPGTNEGPSSLRYCASNYTYYCS